MLPRSATMSLQQRAVNNTNEQGATHTQPRPLIMPDAFDGEASHWDDWISHFESIARVNTWDEQSKLLWLEVRLIDKARKAWNRLPEDSKGSYSLAKTALRNRFEPDSRRDLYAAEFQTQSKRHDKTWQIIYRHWLNRHFPNSTSVQRRNYLWIVTLVCWIVPKLPWQFARRSLSSWTKQSQPR